MKPKRIKCQPRKVMKTNKLLIIDLRLSVVVAAKHYKYNWKVGGTLVWMFAHPRVALKF